MIRVALLDRCAVGRCRGAVQPGQALLCDDHFNALPASLQAALRRERRRLNNWAGKSDAAATAKMINAWGAVVAEALAYLDRVPPTPAVAVTVTAIDPYGWPVSFGHGRLL